MSEPTFKRGTLFRHGSWLDTTPGAAPGTKALCRVTTVRHGSVYYGFGADAHKGRYYADPDKLLARGAVIID
jgi:hypothetical protein